MLEWIKGFHIGVYIVKIMCNSALRDRHWVEMSQIAGEWHGIFEYCSSHHTELNVPKKF